MNQNTLNFLENIILKINDTKFISMLEYANLNKIKNEIYNNINDNNNNNNNIEIKLMKDKIRILLEKFEEFKKDKKEFQFISDYFLGENEKITDIELLNENKSNFNNNNLINYETIDKNFLDNLKNQKLNNFKDIFNFINNENKINNEIKFEKKNSNEMSLLPKINKNKKENNNINSNNKNKNSKNIIQTEKEIEEEINNQIFGYTKRMKESAKFFGAELKKSNKQLSEIEDIQNKGLNSTKFQIKRLTEFNSKISLGFFKLLFMILIVLTTFIFTLFLMRIFPKISNIKN